MDAKCIRQLYGKTWKAQYWGVRQRNLLLPSAQAPEKGSRRNLVDVSFTAQLVGKFLLKSNPILEARL